MAGSLYRERNEGPTIRVHDTLPDATKVGLSSALANVLARNMLAQSYPVQCDDGNGVFTTDSKRVIEVMKARIRGFEWPLGSRIDDGVYFDAIEFFTKHVSMPEEGPWHKFPEHFHLRFDEPSGKRLFGNEINDLLQAGGTLLELTTQGQIQRLGTPEVRAAIRDLRPNSGDQDLDDLIHDASTRYRSRDAKERQIGLEKLWDAFERLKTIEPGKDKKVTATVLLDYIGSDDFRERIATDMEALTKIGNAFRIRHHEKGTLSLPGPEASDYFFARMSTLIIYLLKVSGRLDEN